MDGLDGLRSTPFLLCRKAKCLNVSWLFLEPIFEFQSSDTRKMRCVVRDKNRVFRNGGSGNKIGRAHV